MKEEQNRRDNDFLDNDIAEEAIDNLDPGGTRQHNIKEERDLLSQVDLEIEISKSFKEDIARIIGGYNG
ncbi:hypothetical protein MWH25_07940 [Natroniella acetigena]|uniref:hypothetical protein n=1 Tax=Natroniella acetigena TaxID=52004 RepID=UPI00200A68FD|nr:hypothetical protein [Natroniella acetigena]MCK8827672.1 hypothetical protein [Natroniella acetigena]